MNMNKLCKVREVKAVAGSSLKAVLAALLLAVAMEGPVLAQTTNAADDGTVLKQIIIFGRHSIRSATTGTNSLDECSANPFPDFVGVQVGYLTSRGQLAAGLMGSYFHDYLLHEGLLTNDASSDLAHSYFRANIIERSYMTAAKFGAGLIPGANIPVHTYYPTNSAVADPVFDPILAGFATVDPVRALTEVQGVFGSGTNLSSAYSGELSLISKVLYPPGTHPLYPGISPTTNFPLILTLGVSQLRLSVAEAMIASTVNGAAALALADHVGQIAPGYSADLAVIVLAVQLAALAVRLPILVGSIVADIRVPVAVSGRTAGESRGG